MEICNAGHLPPLLVQEGKVTSIAATGLAGWRVLQREFFAVNRVHMNKGDTLFLYTDGLSESLDGAGNEYGAERLSQLLNDNRRSRHRLDDFALPARTAHLRGGKRAPRRFDADGDQADEVTAVKVILLRTAHARIRAEHLQSCRILTACLRVNRS